MPDPASMAAQQNQASEDAVLRIVCPTQKRLAPVTLTAFLLLVTLSGMIMHARSGGEVRWLPLGILAILGVLLLASLYRSFVFRDTLFIYKGNEVPDGVLVVAAGSIRSVRALPAPEPWSDEAKRDRFGFYPGPIEIDTDSGAFRFGAGLSIWMIEETVDRIAAFCGVSAEGPHVHLVRNGHGR